MNNTVGFSGADNVLGINAKDKLKVHPRRGHEGPEVE
jgi:hypothetical protein